MKDAVRTELSLERQFYQAENVNLSFQMQSSELALEKTIKGSNV